MGSQRSQQLWMHPMSPVTSTSSVGRNNYTNGACRVRPMSDLLGNQREPTETYWEFSKAFGLECRPQMVGLSFHKGAHKKEPQFIETAS